LKILLLKAGEVVPDLRRIHGDYDRWFAVALGARADLEVVPVYQMQPRDPPTRYDGIIMTGSPLSVTEPTEWMRRSAEYLMSAADQKVPVLGVCFGHQLLGYALGVPVIRNPRGREIGSVSIQLTDAGQRDPLFTGIPFEFVSQATHEDIVERLPPNATLLATNANTAVQAMAVGPKVRAVQFHPEIDPSTMTQLISTRQDRLEQEAEPAVRGTRVRSLLAGIRPSPFSVRVLINFLDYFVR
jgi:GMP synthase (glutamine-hydrolysing)